MSDDQNSVPRVAPEIVHETAPALGWYSDHLLFADIWNRPVLNRRDRSVLTISALLAGGHLAQVTGHLNRGLDHGLTQVEVVELLTHLAFQVGWPPVMSAIKIAREVFTSRGLDVAVDQEGRGGAEPVGPAPRKGAGPLQARLEDVLGRTEVSLWSRRDLSVRDRQLATFAAMVSFGMARGAGSIGTAEDTDQLSGEEVAESLVHLALYVGLVRVRSAAETLDAVRPSGNSQL